MSPIVPDRIIQTAPQGTACGARPMRSKGPFLLAGGEIDSAVCSLTPTVGEARQRRELRLPLPFGQSNHMLGSPSASVSLLEDLR